MGALGAVLGRAGHRIVAAYDGEEALRRFRSERVDAVLLDLAMPNLDGAAVRVMRAESDIPILIVSSERDRSAPAELLDLGADDFVRKRVPSSRSLVLLQANHDLVDTNLIVQNGRALGGEPATGACLLLRAHSNVAEYVVHSKARHYRKAAEYPANGRLV